MKAFSIKFILTLLFSHFLLFSQAQYKLVQSESKMFIDGTSSLHDWTETVETINGTLDAVVSGNQISKVSSVKVSIPVKSIKSHKSGMDDNTYKALKESKYPTINYSLKSYGVEGNELYLTGDLSIAGVTKPVKFKSTYSVDGNSLHFIGSYKFKMTDFGIEPPTAIMGTIKTGDVIDIRFDLVYSK